MSEEKYDYRKESFEAIRAMVNHLERNLQPYPEMEAFEFLKHIRYALSDANEYLYKLQNQRIKGADSILNQIGNEEI